MTEQQTAPAYCNLREGLTCLHPVPLRSRLQLLQHRPKNLHLQREARPAPRAAATEAFLSIILLYMKCCNLDPIWR